MSCEESVRTKLTFADVPVATIKDVIAMCEGHNIFFAEALISNGIPESVVLPLVKTHESSRQSPSSMIFGGGGVLGTAIGVYDLDLLKQICTDFGLSTDTPYIGRGYQARVLKTRLQRYLDQREIPPAFRK